MMITGDVVLNLSANINHLARVLLQVEARLASIEETLANPRRGWLFQPDRHYSAEEIERRSGYKPTVNHVGISVVDIRGDYSQYDFKEMGRGRYQLIRVDGVDLTL